MLAKNSPKSAKRQRIEKPQKGLLSRGKNYINNLKENIQSAPIKQRAGGYGKGESDYAFRKRQKQQDDESPDNIKDRGLGDVAGQRLKTEANKLKEKGTNFAKNKIGEAKKYGSQKGKEGLNYAKGKGQEFLNKNPEAAKMFNKAQQVKDDFKNRMGEQSAPIKQRAGETSGEFRKRQKQQDDESPDNIKDRRLGDVAGQRLKTGINKQIGKFTNKQDNPRTAAAIAKADKIKKLAALKAQKFTNRLNKLIAYKNKFKDKIDLVKKFKDDLKRRAKQLALRIAVSTLSAIIAALSEVIVVILIIVIIMVAINYYCNSGGITEAACSAIQGSGSLIY